MPDLPLTSIAVTVVSLLLIKSLPLILAASIFDALIVDIDDDDDLLFTILPFDSPSTFGGVVTGVDGLSDGNAVVVSVIVGDGVAVLSSDLVDIADDDLVNKLLSSDNIGCNVLLEFVYGRSLLVTTSNDFDDF